MTLNIKCWSCLVFTKNLTNFLRLLLEFSCPIVRGYFKFKYVYRSSSTFVFNFLLKISVSNFENSFIASCGPQQKTRFKLISFKREKVVKFREFYRILSSIMCIQVYCTPEFHNEFCQKKIFLFFKNNFKINNHCKFIYHKSYLKPFLSYLPCIVRGEYFSIIFNVKKSTLYSIKNMVSFCHKTMCIRHLCWKITFLCFHGCQSYVGKNELHIF